VIEVGYQREVPYPRPVILSQYFDLEHLEHVHPNSFGRARLLSQHQRVVIWELEWPPLGGVLRLRSTFVQEHLPPWGIRAEIVSGSLRGTSSDVELLESDSGTTVIERHRVALPDWPGLRGFVRKAWVRRLERIWEEDLAVQVCRGGWPGVPDPVDARSPSASPASPGSGGSCRSSMPG
jgi:hypothetical protein